MDKTEGLESVRGEEDGGGFQFLCYSTVHVVISDSELLLP